MYNTCYLRLNSFCTSICAMMHYTQKSTIENNFMYKVCTSLEAYLLLQLKTLITPQKTFHFTGTTIRGSSKESTEYFVDDGNRKGDGCCCCSLVVILVSVGQGVHVLVVEEGVVAVTPRPLLDKAAVLERENRNKILIIVRSQLIKIRKI